jgi:hypothetical protein
VLDRQLIWLTCSVRDTGIGIDSDRLEMMFVAFQQADSSISRRYGGTGLGLSIARTLAERMGGTCARKPRRPGLGVHPGNAAGLASPAPAPRRRRANAGGRRHVLLVEDNPVNQTVIEAMLRSLGFTVSVAEAVEAVAGNAFRRADGLPPADHRRLRSHPADPPTARLRRPADHRPDRQRLAGRPERCLAAGMNDYLASLQTHRSAANSAALGARSDNCDWRESESAAVLGTRQDLKRA